MEDYNTLIIEDTTEVVVKEIPKLTEEVINLIKSVFFDILDSMDKIIFSLGDIHISFLELFCYSAFFIIGIRIISSILWEHE